VGFVLRLGRSLHMYGYTAHGLEENARTGRGLGAQIARLLFGVAPNILVPARARVSPVSAAARR